jgi:hypothetical protein
MQMETQMMGASMIEAGNIIHQEELNISIINIDLIEVLIIFMILFSQILKIKSMVVMLIMRMTMTHYIKNF